jgi:hypothetical protein
MPGPLLRSVGVACCAAWLLAAGAARAESELYWWVTPEGDVQVGPSAPPGVKAVPWDPSAPPPAPAPAPAAAPAPAPAATRHEAPRPRASGPKATPLPPLPGPASAGSEDDDCEKHRGLARQLAASRREIARIEARIEELEATDVSHSFTRCRRDQVRGYDPDCEGGSFDRDAELESAREELGQAHDDLADLEARARNGGVPRECLAGPDD